MRILFFAFIFFLSYSSFSQVFKDGKLYLNEDGSEYVRLTLLNQFWVRYADYNPGSTLYDYPKSSGWDLGIRRFRVQMIARLSPRVFLYSQFGMNNFNFISDRKEDVFVHDALAEFTVIHEKLDIGGGLTAWMNYSRYSSPTIGSIMGLDVPLYQQATVDQTDQFLRRLTVFAKGRLGRLDYHLGMAQPFAIQKSSSWDPNIRTTANFSGRPPNFQYSTYITWQFAEAESMQFPFRVGSYLGTKEVFNIGVGMIYQNDAMWYREPFSLDTLEADMFHVAADIFYDKPVGDKGQSLTLYANYTRFDFGPGYTRNLAIMNPVTGTENNNLLNGGGIGYPAFGTGNVLYFQGGYKMADDWLGTGTLLPYVAVQYADYQRLEDDMIWYEAGVNWLINGHHSKFTLAYQNRPLFETNGELTDRKGSVVLQYQIFFY